MPSKDVNRLSVATTKLVIVLTINVIFVLTINVSQSKLCERQSMSAILSYETKFQKSRAGTHFLTCIPHHCHFGQVVTQRVWFDIMFKNPTNVHAGTPIIRADYYSVC